MKRRVLMVALALFCCMSFCPVFSASAYDSGVAFKTLLKATTTGNGQPITYLKTDRPEVTIAIVEIAPGADTGWHRHQIPVYAYVLEGTLQVMMEGSKTLTFQKGQVFIEVQNMDHNGKNAGKDTVRLLVFYTGAEDMPLAIKRAK